MRVRYSIHPSDFFSFRKDNLQQIFQWSLRGLYSTILSPLEKRKQQLGLCGHTKKFNSSSSFEGYPLQARHKQDWGRGFILLLPQTAALPESDAGSGVKAASSFVIQNRQTSCSMWCSMYQARC